MRKEIPVLFSTAMVQAIIDDRKTQTRRIAKCFDNDATRIEKFNGKWQHVWNASGDPNNAWIEFMNRDCPYGKPGDILWVRESFVYRDKHDKYYYKADHLNSEPYAHNGWKPSIHMPKGACRIWLEVTDVRVERLNDITEEDAKAEGVRLHERGIHWLNYEDQKSGLTQFIYNCRSAKESFRSLWCVINGRSGPAGYFFNPWVWVISFKVLSKTGRPE